MVLGSEPSWLDDLVVPLREALTVLLLLAVVARIADRVRQASRLMRKTLVPVLVVAISLPLMLVVGFIARRAGASDGVVDVVTAVIALSLPALCVAFLVGLFRWRIFTADCLMRLAHDFREPLEAEQRRRLIAQTLGDPSVDLAHWRDGSWVGTDDRPTHTPGGGLGTLEHAHRGRGRAGGGAHP